MTINEDTENIASDEESSPVEKTSQGIIKDVWYGQKSLKQTYWGWGLLFNGLLIGYFGTFATTAISIEVGIHALIYIYIALIQIPITIWVNVGLWRSATNNPGFWAVVVKFLIIIAIGLTFINVLAGLAN